MFTDIRIDRSVACTCTRLLKLVLKTKMIALIFLPFKHCSFDRITSAHESVQACFICDRHLRRLYYHGQSIEEGHQEDR